MRKLFPILIALLVIWSVAAMAQYSSSSDQNNNTSTSSGQSSSGQPQSSTQSSGSSSDMSQGASDKDHSKMKGEKHAKSKKVEGCIVRAESDFLLIPKHGDPFRLTGSQDLSQHVGHRVKVHGTESKGMMGSSTSTSGGMSGTASSDKSSGTAGTAGSSGSISGSTSSGNTGASSSGKTSDMGAGSSTQSSGSMAAHATREIAVESIDMVSETCPSNWNRSATGDHSNVKTSGSTGGPGASSSQGTSGQAQPGTTPK